MEVETNFDNDTMMMSGGLGTPTPTSASSTSSSSSTLSSTKNNNTSNQEVFYDRYGNPIPMSSRPVRSAKVSQFLNLTSEADSLLKKAQYKRAIAVYSRALTMSARKDEEAGYKAALINRAKCHKNIGEAQKALEDVDSVLEMDNEYYRALLEKGEILFTMGEFEFALIYYHRGHKKRNDIEQFRLGIQKCEHAIEESIDQSELDQLLAEKKELNDRTVVPLLKGTYGGEEQGNMAGASSRQSQRKGANKTSSFDTESMIPDDTASTVSEDSERDNASVSTIRSVRNKKGKLLLGELMSDLEFLEQLQQDDTMQDLDDVMGTLNDSLRYLDTRTEFWRQQRSTFAQKKQSVTTYKTDPKPKQRSKPKTSSASAKDGSTPHYLQDTAASSRRGSTATTQSNGRRPRTASSTTSSGKRKGGAGKKKKSKKSLTLANVNRDKYLEETKFAIHSLDSINTALAWGDPELGLRFAKSFLTRLNSLQLSDKPRILGDLYCSMGNAYLKLNKPTLAAIHHKKDLDISVEYNYKDAYVRALGNLGRTYQDLGDYQQAISMWEKKLRLAADQELPKLYTDIGYCLLECEQFQKAIKYQEQIVAVAPQDAQDLEVALKAYYITGTAYYQLGEYENSIQYMKMYTDAAIILNDEEAEADSYHHIGNAYFKLGDQDKSVDYQQKAVDTGNRAKQQQLQFDQSERD